MIFTIPFSGEPVTQLTLGLTSTTGLRRPLGETSVPLGIPKETGWCPLNCTWDLETTPFYLREGNTK